MSEKIHSNLLPQELKHVYTRYQNIIQVLLNMKKIRISTQFKEDINRRQKT